MTYFLRFKDDMKEGSEETPVASTKQLNIRLEKEKKKRDFILKLLYFLNNLRIPNGKHFCNISHFADQSNTSE